MTDLAGTEYFAEIERHWSAFLVSANRVCTKLEAASTYDVPRYSAAVVNGRSIRIRVRSTTSPDTMSA